MKSKKLNICLHDIVADNDDVTSVYDITATQLKRIVDTLRSLRELKVIDEYEIFFDDGYSSVLQVVRRQDFGIKKPAVHAAVITEQLDEPGKLTSKEVADLYAAGFSVDSHGVSHAALAIFDGDILQSSPQNGSYANSRYGKGKALSIQEIDYQLRESSEHLFTITGNVPSSFVLPYGLYNVQVIDIAANTPYERIYTCDAAFDDGQFLAPRLLVTQDTIGDLEAIVRGLPENPKLLV